VTVIFALPVLLALGETPFLVFMSSFRFSSLREVFLEPLLESALKMSFMEESVIFFVKHWTRLRN